MKKSITVIGSSNTDLVVKTASFPKPGETIIGGVFNTYAGGKGANQAVATARLGGDVKFITKIGHDGFGDKLLKEFATDNIDTEYVFRDNTSPSGVAIIIVDGKGENSIVVSPGANHKLMEKEIDDSLEAIKNSSFVLIQLEILPSTVDYSFKIAASLNKKIILNPAPAFPLGDNIYTHTFLITPNETEASILTGITVTDIKSASEAATVLLKKGVKNVVVTLGSKGVFFKNSNEEFHIPAREVEIVDTTAAGDTFNGALAVALAEGRPWRDAIMFANCASSVCVGKLGAQPSIPFRELVDRLLN